jgi:hypothetical protein
MAVLVLSLVLVLVLVLTLAEICAYSSHREACCGDGGESTEGTHWSWESVLEQGIGSAWTKSRRMHYKADGKYICLTRDFAYDSTPENAFRGLQIRQSNVMGLYLIKRQLRLQYAG